MQDLAQPPAWNWNSHVSLIQSRQAITQRRRCRGWRCHSSERGGGRECQCPRRGSGTGCSGRFRGNSRVRGRGRLGGRAGLCGSGRTSGPTTTPEVNVGVGIPRAAVGLGVGLRVNVELAVAVTVSVGVCVPVWVGLGEKVAVEVGVTLDVGVPVADGVDLGVGVKKYPRQPLAHVLPNPPTQIPPHYRSSCCQSSHIGHCPKGYRNKGYTPYKHNNRRRRPPAPPSSPPKAPTKATMNMKQISLGSNGRRERRLAKHLRRGPFPNTPRIRITFRILKSDSVIARQKSLIGSIRFARKIASTPFAAGQHRGT